MEEQGPGYDWSSSSGAVYSSLPPSLARRIWGKVRRRLGRLSDWPRRSLSGGPPPKIAFFGLLFLGPSGTTGQRPPHHLELLSLVWGPAVRAFLLSVPIAAGPFATIFRFRRSLPSHAGRESPGPGFVSTNPAGPHHHMTGFFFLRVPSKASYDRRKAPTGPMSRRRRTPQVFQLQEGKASSSSPLLLVPRGAR